MRVHAGYVICQNDIFSNSSVVGHILIVIAMMLQSCYTTLCTVIHKSLWWAYKNSQVYVCNMQRIQNWFLCSSNNFM